MINIYWLTELTIILLLLTFIITYISEDYKNLYTFTISNSIFSIIYFILRTFDKVQNKDETMSILLFLNKFIVLCIYVFDIDKDIEPKNVSHLSFYYFTIFLHFFIIFFKCYKLTPKINGYSIWFFTKCNFWIYCVRSLFYFFLKDSGIDREVNYYHVILIWVINIKFYLVGVGILLSFKVFKNIQSFVMDIYKLD